MEGMSAVGWKLFCFFCVPQGDAEWFGEREGMEGGFEEDATHTLFSSRQQMFGTRSSIDAFIPCPPISQFPPPPHPSPHPNPSELAPIEIGRERRVRREGRR